MGKEEEAKGLVQRVIPAKQAAGAGGVVMGRCRLWEWLFFYAFRRETVNLPAAASVLAKVPLRWAYSPVEGHVPSATRTVSPAGLLGLWASLPPSPKARLWTKPQRRNQKKRRDGGHCAQRR